MPVKTERITFPGHSGDLAARVDRPAGPIRAQALFAHCFTCSKDIAAARRIAARLSQMGVAVLRFDFTGLGHSQGEFANTNFSSNVQDLEAAVDWLRQNHRAPDMLIGHSLGGAAVIAAAERAPEAKAIVTIGAPYEPAHVIHNFGADLDVIERDGEAVVSLAGRPFKITKQFVEDVRASSLEQKLAKLGKALLVMHAPLDATVGVENAGQIFGAAKHPKSFVTLDDADHLVSRQEDADYAADVIASWATRYLPPAPPPETKDAPPEGVTRVAETGEGRFLNDVNVEDLHLYADEPVSVGGSGKGMSPYQFVAAGLGACTSMTLRMYARRKKLPLDKVEVDVIHDKIHAEDCEDCETKDGKVDVFQRIIRLEGDLDDAQRTRLLEIADRCPVHRTLENEVKIRTRLA